LEDLTRNPVNPKPVNLFSLQTYVALFWQTNAGAGFGENAALSEKSCSAAISVFGSLRNFIQQA
jgi:hypothetical protein